MQLQRFNPGASQASTGLYRTERIINFSHLAGGFLLLRSVKKSLLPHPFPLGGTGQQLRVGDYWLRVTIRSNFLGTPVRTCTTTSVTASEVTGLDKSVTYMATQETGFTAGNGIRTVDANGDFC